MPMAMAVQQTEHVINTALYKLHEQTSCYIATSTARCHVTDIPETKNIRKNIFGLKSAKKYEYPAEVCKTIFL